MVYILDYLKFVFLPFCFVELKFVESLKSS